MKIESPRLQWIPSYVESLNRALDGAVGDVAINFDPTDALKATILLRADRDLGRHWNDIAALARAFAGANDCVLHRCRKPTSGGHGVELEVLTKRRLGPDMNHNPLEGERHVRFSRR